MKNFLFSCLYQQIIIFNILILFSDNSFSHWSMVGWMLLIPVASNQTYLDEIIQTPSDNFESC